MATIHFEGRSIALAAGETVLDGLLGAGIDAPHSCRAGHCRACLARAVDGEAPPGSQEGLKDAWRAQGLFLTCRAVPTSDLSLAATNDLGLEVGGTVIESSMLSHDVVRLRLALDEPFEHRGGQFVTLVRNDGLARSYSAANVPGRDDFLELHVRVVPGGAMSGWIAQDVRVGQRLAVRGPAGECFYVAGRREQPLLLVGTGTGLAPLFAIARDALRHEHAGRVVLVHGALDARGLYLVDELTALARSHDNFEYHRCLLSGEPSDRVAIGPIHVHLQAQLPSLAGWRVFLCGHPELVVDLRKRAFLAGASMKDIHADAFVMKAAPTAPITTVATT